MLTEISFFLLKLMEAILERYQPSVFYVRAVSIELLFLILEKRGLLICNPAPRLAPLGAPQGPKNNFVTTTLRKGRVGLD
jgi:hypothetical protein